MGYGIWILRKLGFGSASASQISILVFMILGGFRVGEVNL